MANRSKTTKSAGRQRTASTALAHRRTRSDHAKEIAEDYVELIDTLITDAGEARAVDLARHLGVTHVTVTKTIDRLKKEGLVTSKPYRSIFLTPEGKKLAEFTRRRHESVYDFLIALGVPKTAAAVDAEGIEHHISPATLAAMKRFTGKLKS